MAATMRFSRQREKTMVMRTKYLFEIYMREGNTQLRNRQYRNAIESYDSALQLNSSNMTALVGKSQCHMRLGHVKQALADVELALAIDNISPPAVLQKADIFYALHNFEMALLFYHRGHKVSPEVIAFQEGITNCQKHISDESKGGKPMKLTEAGDLTIYVHKKMKKMSKPGDNRDKRRRTSSPRIPSRQPSSAGRINQQKEMNPLVRLGRKQPIKLTVSCKRSKSNPNRRYKPGSRASGGTVYSEPDEKTMKEILGKLYGDRLYLQKFLKETEEESRLDVEVSVIAENGLQFLLDRVTYWNHRRLPPDPIPSPPLSRKRSRQGSSTQRMLTESPLPRQKSSLWEREVSDLIRVLNNDYSHEDSTVEEGIVGYRPYKKEKKKVRKLYFEFATYRPGSDTGERGRGGTAMDRQKEQTQMSDIEEDEEEDEAEDYILNYVTKELANIENAFDQEDFDQCRRMAVTCLQTVYNYSDDDIADKLDLIAKIHSILGNVLLDQGEVEEAQYHHEKDLEIGEKCKLNEAESRALGNLGRVFIHEKHFHKALGAFARKTKLVVRPVETAWLFHEIGDCFLTLNQYGYARDAGRKSLEAAEDAQHRMYQLQACVLIGVAHVKLRDYDEAYLQFERGLDFARIEGDRESEEMIVRALNEVNLRISERTKKETERAQDVRKTSSQKQSTQQEERQTTPKAADDSETAQPERVKEDLEKTIEADGIPKTMDSVENTGIDGPNSSDSGEENRIPRKDSESSMTTATNSQSPTEEDSIYSHDEDEQTDTNSAGDSKLSERDSEKGEEHCKDRKSDDSHSIGQRTSDS